MRYALPFLSIVLVASQWGYADQESLSRDARSILSDNCFHCHGPDANSREADLRLDTREGLFGERDGGTPAVPGKPDQSELLRRVLSKDPDLKMPPPHAKITLSAKQVATLKRWIEAGAPWQGHWSFSAPVKPALPRVANANWTRNPIDFFIAKRLEAAGLKPQAAAEKQRLLRRVTLDLTGLPPTLHEIDAFLADRSDNAYEKVVDRLLMSKSYGERMAWDWLDAARYADSNGYQGDRERTMWPWRDWVVRSLNENMPFDQFSIWQLAGDLLDNPTDEQKLATGFCRNHMINGEGGRIPEENRIEYVFDQTETMGTVWMGLTLTCCRCHDHKFDPLSKQEYFQLFAFFNRTPVSGGGGDPAMAPNMQFETPAVKRQVAALQQQVAQLDGKIASRRAAISKLQQQWERQFAGKSGKSLWGELTPITLKSANGQKLETQQDGAVFASGPNPATDTYTIVAKSPVNRLAAIRLEGLRHPSFTKGGIARSNSGNFVLTNFEVSIKRPQDKQPQKLKFASAVANVEQRGHQITNALNSDSKSGWAVLQADWKKDVTGIFYLAKPLEDVTNAELTITMRHDSQHAAHNIGRFRLAASDKTGIKLGEQGDAFLAAISVAAEKRNAAQKRIVAERYYSSDAELNALNATVDARRKQIAGLRKSLPRVMIMQDVAKPRKTLMLTRGIYNKTETEVSTGLPDVLPSLKSRPNPNRLDLARWLLDPKHPLTARVTVNRVWQQFFGTGLVKTTEDFGIQGEMPSHPQLLDWLAVTFIESDWDVKALQRLIVTSAAYRQAARVSEKVTKVDPSNRLISRGPRYRMPSWMIRDHGLAASGLLVDRSGGAPVYPYQPQGIWAEATFGKKRYKQDSGAKLYRRSLYSFWRRIVGPTMFFDVAKRQTCSVRNSRTNTPLHALTTLNDITYVEIARAMAERVLRNGDTLDQQIQMAFRLATSRRPTEVEGKILSSRFRQLHGQFAAQPEEAKKLLAVGDSAADPSLDLASHAAMTGVCQLLLNLDESLSN